MLRIYQILLLLFFVLGLNLSYGQDIHFSQFYANPLTLNPANTGNFAGAWRVAGIGRREWKLDYDNEEGSPFRTMSLGFDLPIVLGRNKLGAGVNVVKDASGPAQLSLTKITGSLAFEFNVSGNKIRIGLQPTVDQYKMGKDKMIGNDDVNESSDVNDPNDMYNTGNVFGEPSLGGDKMSSRYFDLHGGALWTKKMGKLTPEAGISVFHILKPNYSLLEGTDTEKLSMRFVYNVSAEYTLNDKVSLYPNLLFMGQSKAQNVIIGMNLGYSLVDRIELIEKVFIGSELRMLSGKNKEIGKLNNSDAIIAIAGVKLPKLRIGVSRDFTISRLQQSFPMVGAWEISVIYIAPDVLLKKKLLPCDRY